MNASSEDLQWWRSQSWRATFHFLTQFSIITLSYFRNKQTSCMSILTSDMISNHHKDDCIVSHEEAMVTKREWLIDEATPSWMHRILSSLMDSSNWMRMYVCTLIRRSPSMIHWRMIPNECKQIVGFGLVSVTTKAQRAAWVTQQSLKPARCPWNPLKHELID